MKAFRSRAHLKEYLANLKKLKEKQESKVETSKKSEVKKTKKEKLKWKSIKEED